MIKKILLILGAILVMVFGFLFLGWPTVNHNTVYGVTWSKPYAESLGLDPYAGLQAVLDDLSVRHFRIPVYWTEVEPKQGEFYWDSLTRQLEMIHARDGKVILVLGAKQPRWPEWWVPAWVEMKTPQEQKDSQKLYVETVIKHFAPYGSMIEAWQVENESQFPFGQHAPQDPSFVTEEMQLVRRVSQEQFPAGERPLIVTTDSGELSLWLGFHRDVDALGVSAYRAVVGPVVGLWHYWFVPPWFYARKATLLRPWIKSVFVSEFQMEPWARKPLTELTPDEQIKNFDLPQMKKNFWFAERMNMSQIYFWGAEWWYWMKVKQNHPEFWEGAKGFFRH